MDAERLREEYKKWHWGEAAKGIVEWNDPVLDRALLLESGMKRNPKGKPGIVECGRLVEIHVREPDKRSDSTIRLTRAEANGSHLVFNPSHHSQRLHVLSAPGFKNRMVKSYLSSPKYDFLKLEELAQMTKGRHATKDYLPIKVMPIGAMTHVVYACPKGGDGYSFYIHELGEISGIRPYLSVDANGRMWIAGGDYTVPEPGITN